VAIGWIRVAGVESAQVDERPICVRCHKPVKFAAPYQIQERMHFLCFHLEFEHGDYDPDEPCTDPGCYWRIDQPWRGPSN
jgi:hypothetical protein